ncbi:MAG: NAD-dependent epimerase/dehydratase family protein [Actinomycetota bacterium]|nr:NAD-dependent epimerase/dehydratase family protein [Actinomycetota bacterium]
MKILVTGAAGFLGRHITSRLLAEGFDVTAFDQQPIAEDPYAVVGDLLDGHALLSASRGHEVICHVGAIGDVYLARERPALAASVNVTGSANVAAVAREVGAGVVYASTWEVYGPPVYQPIDEDHPCAPDHPYNITKLAGERMLLAAHHLDGVPVIALRLGTAYGAGLRPNSVFRIFIDKARRQEPITIQGDGSQGRQFTHASDIANAFAMACRSELEGLALNIVGSEMVSIRRLAELVANRYPTKLTFGQPRPGDIAPARVSARRAKEALGWEEQVSFEAGLADLMDRLESTS